MGNVAALNKRSSAKSGAKKLPEKRQSARAKFGPPPSLDACVDGWPPACQDALGYPSKNLGRHFLVERAVGRTKSMPTLTNSKGSLPPVPLAPQRGAVKGERRKSLAARR